MNKPLCGEKADEFLDWLDEVKHLLPGSMSIKEARLVWQRKIEDENRLQRDINETNDKDVKDKL